MDASGHYEGFMVAGSASDPVQSSISADVQAMPTTANEVKLKITTNPAHTEIDFEVQVSDNGIALSSASSFFKSTLELHADQNHCFTNAGNQLCYDGTQLSVVLAAPNAAKFVMSRMAPLPAPSLEPPRSYSVPELIQRAQARSFTSEIEFETLVQTKLTAENGYLNLLPHINIGSALDLVGFVPLTMVRAIGDLVPFFLPNRWFQAAALKDGADAEFDSYRVVQASAMNIVQGLALSVLRDEQALQTMEQNRVQITQIRDEVLASEHNGSTSVQVGASDDITSVLNTLIISIDSMKENILEEKTALSQAAGFNNPSAVSQVLPVNLPSINGPIPGNLSDYDTAAVNRSLALLQINDLVSAAQNTQIASGLQWLDPTGADQGSLGFGIVSYVQVDGSLVNQLFDKKDLAQSQLLMMVQNALTRSKDISDQYLLSGQASQTNQNRIDRLLLNFRSGIQFEMASLVGALSDKTTSDINQVNAQYAFVTLQAQMDFLTYSGPYAGLLSEQNPASN
jgi:hypothetical protein